MKELLQLLLCAVAIASVTRAQNCFCVEEIEAAEGFLSPTVLENAGDRSGRMFFGEQQGMVWTWEKDGAGEWQRLDQPFLNLTELVFVGNAYSERGFLSMSFHPDHEDNGLLYLYYSVQIPGGANTFATVLTEVSVFADDPNRVDTESERVLLKIDQPFSNHNGGQIFWGGDVDGGDADERTYLYVSIGDGGSAGDPFNYALNPGVAFGKIFRIDPLNPSEGREYGIPASNPFLNDPDFLPEIYNLGLRNPWRVSVDKPTGNVFIADVGQNAWEEIDIMTPGGNYGWAAYEAEVCYKSELCPDYEREDLEWPIYSYDHSDGAKSVTGGFVYRGCNNPGFQGNYYAADWVQGFLLELVDNGDGSWTGERMPTCSGCSAQNPKWSDQYAGFIQTFGVDEDGELYMGSKEGRNPDQPSHVYRLIDPNTYVDEC